MQITLRLVAPPSRPAARWWPAIVTTLALWRQRSRSRRHLAALDARELADIGVSRAEQQVECAKGFWEP